MRRIRTLLLVAAVTGLAVTASAQVVTVDTSAGARQQTIDGFGTCLSGTEAQAGWWRDLFFDDLGASIVRFDITPRWKSPYADHVYNSPWFGNTPALPGPEGNNVRTYTGPGDYTRSFAGQSAAIAVMGPDIDANVALFDYEDAGPKTAGLLAQIGNAKKATLGDFKLIASMWSPSPWLKVTSGGTWGGGDSPLPPAGVAWPFIWGGNFAGGKLDTSGTPLAVFDDGTGPTSALTQFARTLAAYLRGFQQKFGVTLYAVSIQNELTFEEFYSSCTYPHADGYLAALKAARAELDKYDDLRGIRIMGPEDLMGGDAYSLWQYGGGDTSTHKNLQFLQAVAADPVAAAALDFVNIHGYAPDGVSSAGADPVAWSRWAGGWTASPAAGIPDNVKGFVGYGKKSWMTETSGETSAWRDPASGYPGNGAFSIAVKIQQALTSGRQSGWVYWQMTDGQNVSAQTLTDATLVANGPKYVAAKHFFRFIRPGAVRVGAAVTGATDLGASAFLDGKTGDLTIVLTNQNAAARTVNVVLPTGFPRFDSYTSSEAGLWKTGSVTPQTSMSVATPGYGVVTLVGSPAVAPPSPDGGTAVVRPDGGGSGPGAGVPDAPASPGGGGGAETGNASGGCSVGGSGVSLGGLLLGLAVLTIGRARRRRATR